jgi:plasmid stability protein
MGKLIIPDLSDETIEALKAEASIHGRTVEQEARRILEQSQVRAQPRIYTTEERVALTKRFLAEYPDVQPTLSAEERREGLM